ncbi:MAG: potassium channel family protein [Rubrobacteraceae bacterium]
MLVVLRDVFHQLFHPGGSGHLSDMLARSVWRMFQRLNTRYSAPLGLAAPTALVVVITSWTALLAVGWALVYWPYMPESFLYSTGLSPSANAGFIDAFYLSLMTMTTLGYGDITPTAGMLRVLNPVQSLIGFGLLTASVTWVLSIYPALSRRRTLAQEISLLHIAESKGAKDISEMDAQTVEQLFRDLASRLAGVRNDLRQFGITYYFHGSDEHSALAAGLPYVAHLAKRGRRDGHPEEVRLSSDMLAAALDDFADALAPRFLALDHPATTKVLEAYARDHRRETLSHGDLSGRNGRQEPPGPSPNGGSGA